MSHIFTKENITFALSIFGSLGTLFTLIHTFLINRKQLQITNISILDIRDSDYRVEYRLNAFKNAVGEKGFIGNTEIQIVNYGVYPK